MVTTDALKLLYKKLGETADVDNITAISDMVDLIEDVAGGGGGGGASGIFVIHATGTAYELTLDKNYDEINTAINSGLLPVIVHSFEDNVSLIYIVYIYYDTEDENTPYKIDASSSPSAYIFASDSATGTMTGSLQ